MGAKGPPPLTDALTGYSRALHANWLWHKTLRIVVDAGEGLQLGLGPRVSSPSHMLITHGHSDHVLGLPGFVSARRFGRSDPKKPLSVLYPEGSAGVAAVLDAIGRHWPGEAFPLELTAVTPGFEADFGRNRVLRAFATDHASADAHVGWMVVERRRKRRAAFADLDNEALQQAFAEHGREQVLEEVEQILFAHTGDTMPLSPDLFRGADVLVMDATFLDGADRRESIHATTTETIEVGRDAGVRALVLHHLWVANS